MKQTFVHTIKGFRNGFLLTLAAILIIHLCLYLNVSPRHIVLVFKSCAVLSLLWGLGLYSNYFIDLTKEEMPKPVSLYGSFVFMIVITWLYLIALGLIGKFDGV